uniref:Uncharacterized protein n=1 Tax=Aegilops tauschii TaxID=37682 RepID=M8BBN7_AEGTA
MSVNNIFKDASKKIHEVDDEVLPLLTLEDLKDMGIGAVGSRRKMFAAIQKLRSTDTVS